MRDDPEAALAQWRGFLLGRGYADGTVKIRTTAVGQLLRHADVGPERMTAEDVAAWFAHSSPRWKAWTRAKYVESVKAWAVWVGRPDLGAVLRVPKTPRGIPKPITELELAALLRACRPGTRDRPWVLLGAFCGLRAHESAKVAGEDLEESADGSWHLRVLGKGGQLATVPCPDLVVRELRPLIERQGRGRLWPSATSDTVQSVIRRLGQRAGLHGVTSHRLRHRYGTAFYETSGHDLLLTQQVMRHADPGTTAGYARVAASRANAVVSALPGAAAGRLDEDGRPRLRVVR